MKQGHFGPFMGRDQGSGSILSPILEHVEVYDFGQLGGFVIVFTDPSFCTATHLPISNLTGKSAVSIGESSSNICYFPATGETSEGQDYWFDHWRFMNSNLSRVSFSIPRFSWLNPTCPLKPYILFLSEIPYVVAWNSVCIYVYIYTQFLRIGWEELQEPQRGGYKRCFPVDFPLPSGNQTWQLKIP